MERTSSGISLVIRMRIRGTRSGYDRVPNGEEGTPAEYDAENLPPEPPEYVNDVDEEGYGGHERSVEPMFMEEAENNERLVCKIRRFRDQFSDNVVEPVKERIMDPLAQLLSMASDKIDHYLNKIGNPLILRRFFYIFAMSTVTYLVLSSGFIPSERASGYKGMFSDHDVLLKYARSSIDLSKFERDWEYLSSMPHMSGTKGDSAIRHFVMESMNNNKLRVVRENEYLTYATYPEEMYLKAFKGDKEVEIKVTPDNFNPLSASGTLNKISLIYANMGTNDDLQRLKEQDLLNGDYVLLVHYGEIVSEQVLVAEKYGAKGILFITDSYEDNNVIQQRSVGIPQYWVGDALHPGLSESIDVHVSAEDSKSIPKIPTMPLSWNQASELLSLIPEEGVQFEDRASGKPGEVLIDLQVKMAVREGHPVYDVVGKIGGREQNDKAIIIAASRTSPNNGATYPSFGTAMLLSLLQTFQELKYKYDWKPLRNIYLISYGGTEFNYLGSAELVKQSLAKLKDEVYSVIDISQLTFDLDDKKLDVQAHPLLHQFFRDEVDNMGFDVSLKHVKQYGDWTPFMANGIPVSVLSSPKVLRFEPPLGTSQDTFEAIDTLSEDSNKREALSELLMFAFQSALKLADKPFIPYDVSGYVQYMSQLLDVLKNKWGDQLDCQGVIDGLLTWRNIGEEWAAWHKGWQNIVFSREEGMEPSLISVHRWTWNKKLSNIGRRQCYPDGLIGRPYYKNVLLGPTVWTQKDGEEYWSFPGVRDAIYEEDWQLAQDELTLVAKALEYSATIFLEETTDVGN